MKKEAVTHENIHKVTASFLNFVTILYDKENIYKILIDNLE